MVVSSGRDNRCAQGRTCVAGFRGLAAACACSPASVAALLAGWLMEEGRAWVHSALGEAQLAERRVRFRFGDSFELVGYTLSDDSVSPGDRVWLTVYWSVRAPSQADKTLPTEVPTSEWPEGALVGDEHIIELPLTSLAVTFLVALEIVRTGMYASVGRGAHRHLRWRTRDLLR